MKMSSTFLAAASVLALGVAAIAPSVSAEEAAATEKCYGVAKAGQNDCGATGGAHSCAGQAAADADGNEWVNVPKGLCDKLAGGSLTPKS